MKALYRKWSGTAVIRLVTALTLFMFTALALNSCCRHHKLTYEDDEQAISLSVTSAGTKAVVDDLAGMVSQCFTDDDDNADTGFGVYGYKKQVDGSSIILFNNKLVYPDEKAESTAWSYQNTRYWDSNPAVSYQFIAYWPYMANASSNSPYVEIPVSTDNKALTIYNIPNWQPVTVNGSEVDYMTATASGQYRTSIQNESPAFSSGTVKFQFRHVLSQLVIKAYYVGKELNIQNTGGVKINSISLSAYTPQGEDETAIMGQLKTAGKIGQAESTFQVLGGTTSTLTQRYDQEANITATMAGNCQLQQVSNSPIVFKDEFSQDANYLTNFTPSVIGRWLFVPHVWYKQYMVINYSIGNSAKETSIPVALIRENDYSTQPGKAYVLTLVLDATEDGLTVEQIAVKNWNELDVNKEVYNW